mgnify:FL=1
MKTHNENCIWALSLNMQFRQSIVFIFLILGPFSAAFCQDEIVFTYENPFYEDCRLVDQPTHQYIKNNDIKYLKKTIKIGRDIAHVTQHFYNERAVLDSVVETNETGEKKLSVYTYDSLFRLTSKIDSFKNKTGWDSLYVHHWIYGESGTIQRIEQGWSFFDQPGFQRHTFMPTIIFDTVISDMVRYKMVEPMLDEQAKLILDKDPTLLWVRDGRLVLYGTDSVYSSIDVSDIGDEYEMRYHLYKGDSVTLMRIRRYDIKWQIKASKVFYKGEWVLLQDHRYDRSGYELMNTKYDPVSGIKSTTTFIRDQENGRIDKELSPVTYTTLEGKPPRISVTEVTYFYSSHIE